VTRIGPPNTQPCPRLLIRILKYMHTYAESPGRNVIPMSVRIRSQTDIPNLNLRVFLEAETLTMAIDKLFFYQDSAHWGPAYKAVTLELVNIAPFVMD
jgi:hypothetical protein